MAVTTVRLQPEVEEHLEELAKRLQRTKGWLINQALTEYLARHEEERKRWQETLDAMESVAKGRVISGDRIVEWLQSWGSENELPPPKVGE